MGNVYAYNNQLWKEVHRFEYTGSPQPFTLQPGTYLLQCHGGHGAKTSTNAFDILGGSSFGILNLSEAKSMYAYVGGNGTQGVNGVAGIGGWNGGADGGLGYSGYTAGSGGGGASDIRLKRPEDFQPDPHANDYTPELPEGYTQVKYIETDGSQYFDSGYCANTNTVFTFETSYTDTSRDMAILGSQSGQNVNPGWAVWLDSNESPYSGQPTITSIYGTMGWDGGSYVTPTGVTLGQKAVYIVDQFGVIVNNTRIREYTYPSGTPETDQTIIIMGCRRYSSVMDRTFIGKLYYFRIYETDTTQVRHLVREYIPCKRTSDGQLGLYEMKTDTFIIASHISGDTEVTCALADQIPYTFKKNDTGLFDLEYTFPDEYQLVDYIEGTGTQYINTGYILKATDVIVCDTTILRDNPNISPNNEFVFGNRYGNGSSAVNAFFVDSKALNTTFMLAVSKQSYNETSFGPVPAGPDDTNDTRHIGLYMFKNSLFVTNADGVNALQTQTGSDYPGNYGSFYLFECNCATSSNLNNPGYIMYGTSTVQPAQLRMHKFYVYNGNGDVIHAYLPCYRKADDVTGLYDIMTGDFLTNAYPNGGEFVLGDDLDELPRITSLNLNPEDPSVNKSLNTRIIVAGGGGGGSNDNASYDNHSLIFTGIGGGAVGGMVSSYQASAGKYASQDAGFSFGNGQTPPQKTGGYNGASGGGGGWYGGYCVSETSGQYCSGNGGGGSGYVLTANADPEGTHSAGSDFYMTNPFMNSGIEPSTFISISVPLESLSINDKIIAYPTGSKQTFQLPPGIYTLKCWGGDGGINSSPVGGTRGGYSEGTLQLPKAETLHVFVGGTGMYDNLLTSEYVHQLKPDLSWNGGGTPSSYGGYGYGRAGGGATDIRIVGDTLYDRIIVAGGAGGAVNGAVGGAGGGESGGNNGYTNEYNYWAGPGTQTGAGVNQNLPGINGGFGYGGNGYAANYATPGGAGGGGWYGGSGGKANDWGSAPSGAGGSGYVYTQDSFRPVGYNPPEEYELSGAVGTSTGGNDLPYGVTRAEIEVIDAKNYRVLCRDMYGIKRFDADNNEWVLTDTQDVSPELFEEYGVYSVDTDNGLADDYVIMVYDPNDEMDTVIINAVPNKQTITNEMISSIPIRKIKPEMEFDPNVFDIDITVNRRIIGDNIKILTTIQIDKKMRSNAIPKIYYISYTNTN